MRGAIYIQLRNYSSCYLVVIIADEEFQYALITTIESTSTNMIIEEVAFLDSVRIHGDDPTLSIRDRVETQAAVNHRRPNELMEPAGNKVRTGCVSWTHNHR